MLRDVSFEEITQDNQIRHNCGLVVAPTLSIAHKLLSGVQHRGKEAAGFALFRHDGKIDTVKWVGEVGKVEVNDLMKLFRRERYHTVAGHVRYATRGRKDQILQDAHPHTIGGRVEVSSHNPNLVYEFDCDYAIVHNGQVETSLFLDEIVSTELRSDCDSEALLHFYANHGHQRLLREIPGAYTCAIMDGSRNQTLVMRDQSGIKPGFHGFVEGMQCFASEDYVFKKGNNSLEGKIRRGSAYIIDSNGRINIESVVTDGKKNFCMFEIAYVANKLSTLEGINVETARRRLGQTLAKDFESLDADYVTYLPRCPEDAAKEFSNVSGIPFLDLFYKERSDRSFQESNEGNREASISSNLGINPEPLRFDSKGNRIDLQEKTIILIDDSIVRGNNSKKARDLLYAQGVKEVIILSYTPKVGIIGEDGVPRGCSYGVDMPYDDNFVVRTLGDNQRNRTDEEINEALGMKVGYLSVDSFMDTLSSFGVNREEFCYHCIGGSKPF